MQNEKQSALMNWPTPQNKKQLHRFLAFAKIYRDYIDHYRDIAKPLYKLLKQDAIWVWTRLHDEAFAQVKEAYR